LHGVHCSFYLYAIAALVGPAKGKIVVDLKPTCVVYLLKSAFLKKPILEVPVSICRLNEDEEQV
jgi:hypothetical protein